MKTFACLASAAALTGAAALLAAAPASAATTLIAGEVNTDPALNFLTQNAGGGFDSHFADRPGHDSLVPNKLDLFAGTEVTQFAATGEGGAHAALEAHWNDANSGTIQASGGWSLPSANLDPSGPVTEVVGAVSSSDGPAWSYTFAVGQGGAFNLGFSFSARGDTDGLGVWDMRVTDNGQTLAPRTVLDLNEDHGFDTAGQLSQRLQAGHTYTISLNSDEIHFGLGPQPPVSNVEDASFNWSIAASGAPEPSTWALAILGFGLAGAAVRRRRAVEQFA